jgi:hypothetical protein
MSKSGKLLLLLLACSCMYPVISDAQEIKFPYLQGFKQKVEYPVYTPETLWDFIDGAADKYLSYGFTDAHVCEYIKGHELIKAEIYRLKSNTMAFGIYSYERSPSYGFLKMGSQGYVTDGAYNFFKGDFYVKLRTYSKKPGTLQAEQKLAASIAAMLEGPETMPEALALFPADGKVENSEVFLNEGVLGHSFLSSTFRADYQVGTDNFSVYIIRSENPESSRKTVESYLAATGTEALGPGEDKYVLSDGYNGKIFIAWKEDVVVLVSGLAGDQSEIADRYISAILK